MLLDPLFDRIIFTLFATRHDGSPSLRYFDPVTYGVSKEPFTFYSGKNKLTGARYFTSDNPEALIVLFHGAFAGHWAYSDIIAELAKRNYLVYSFDYTGCMQSEGTNCIGMQQPFLDQKAFFEFLDKDEKAQGLTRYALGHSWGGFISLGCLQEQYNVEKVICISGFDSVYNVFADKTPLAKKFRFPLLRYFKHRFGSYGLFDGVEEMKKTSKEVLVVFGEKDSMVPTDKFFTRYKEALKDKPNIHFELVEGRGHQPFYTQETQDYFVSFYKENSKRHKEDKPSLDMDYSRINLDPKVMNVLFDFLKG